MGLIGCTLARKLQQEGIEFSWEDNDAVFSAWKASTGCVYPSGNPKDAYNYKKFQDSAAGLGMEYEVADYCFSQNSIPHKENSKELSVNSTDGQLKFLNLPSFHVNVQDFVLNTREKFKSLRRQEAQDVFTIHANGFHQYHPSDWRWGWSTTAKVTLKTPSKQRICFNLKEGRFVNVYLYPKPQTEDYYFGTSFIFQRKMKNLETDNKIIKSLAHAKSKIENFAGIELFGEVQQGWRPAYTSDSLPDYHVHENNMYLKPQMANGVRHHISFFENIMDGIKGLYAPNSS